MKFKNLFPRLSRRPTADQTQLSPPPLKKKATLFGIRNLRQDANLKSYPVTPTGSSSASASGFGNEASPTEQKLNGHNHNPPLSISSDSSATASGSGTETGPTEQKLNGTRGSCRTTSGSGTEASDSSATASGSGTETGATEQKLNGHNHNPPPFLSSDSSAAASGSGTEASPTEQKLNGHNHTPPPFISSDGTATASGSGTETGPTEQKLNHNPPLFVSNDSSAAASGSGIEASRTEQKLNGHSHNLPLFLSGDEELESPAPDTAHIGRIDVNVTITSVIERELTILIPPQIPLQPTAPDSDPIPIEDTDPTSTAVARILEIIPNVEPTHLLQLVETHLLTYSEFYGNHDPDADGGEAGEREASVEEQVQGVVGHVLHLLFENPDYPKADLRAGVKGKGKRVGDPVDEDDVEGVVELVLDLLFENSGYPKGDLRASEMGNGKRVGDPVDEDDLEGKGKRKAKDSSPKKPKKSFDENKQQRRPYALKSSRTTLKKPQGDVAMEEEKAWLDAESAGGGNAKEVDETLDDVNEDVVIDISDDGEDNGAGVKCQWCFVDYPFSEMVQCPEAHLFCSTCISTYASTQLGIHNSSLICISCSLPLPPSELKRILSMKQYKLYEKLEQQKEIRQAEEEKAWSEEEKAWLDAEWAGGGNAKEVDETLDDVNEDVIEISDDEDNDTGIECQWCFVEYPFSEMVQCPEAHLFCSTCISTYVCTQLGTLNSSLTCIHPSLCSLPFPPSELKRILSMELYELYEELERKEIRQAEEEKAWLDAESAGGGNAKEVDETLDDVNEDVVIDISDDGEDNGTGIECQCCFTDYPFSEMVQCPEAHLFCSICISTYASTRLGTLNSSLICIHPSSCSLPFPPSELRRILSVKLYELYEKLEQQKEIRQAGLVGLEECPFCEWKCVIEASTEEDIWFRCGNVDGDCGVVSCRDCKKLDHWPKRCKEVEEDKRLDRRHAIDEAMSRALMRNCPKCQKAFIKEQGCNKMICPNCKTPSCYICRLVITGYDHFNKQPGRPSTSADAMKCLLWDAVEERHDQDVKEAAEKAMEEYGHDDGVVAPGHQEAVSGQPLVYKKI